MTFHTLRLFAVMSLAALLVAAGCAKKKAEVADAVKDTGGAHPPAATAQSETAVRPDEAAAAAAHAEAAKEESAKPERAPDHDTVALVAPGERSRHFATVNRHLELGGTLYGYIDIDGDAEKLAASLRRTLVAVGQSQPQLATYLDQDYAAIFATLGLTDVKAAGISSARGEDGVFRNRVFLATPDGRHGLLAALGGEPGRPRHLELAGAETDYFMESEVDLAVAYAAIREVVAKIGGGTAVNKMETTLKSAGAPMNFSAYEFVQKLKGRMAVAITIDPTETVTLPGPERLRIPAFSILAALEGVGPTVEGLLTKSPALVAEEEGGRRIFRAKSMLPVGNLQPAFAIEGTTLYFASTPAVLRAGLQRSGGLAAQPEFQRAFAALGGDGEPGVKGNGLSYLRPEFFARFRELESMNPQASAETKRALAMIAEQLPVFDTPAVAVRSNDPDGILIRAASFRSLKKAVVMSTMYNPVALGLLTAMAVPAFQKVRQASQEKAVLNNLRLLSAAASQYYLEHGVGQAKLEDLVGPDKYIRVLRPVMGEDYSDVIFASGEPLRVRLPNGRVIEYNP